VAGKILVKNTKQRENTVTSANIRAGGNLKREYDGSPTLCKGSAEEWGVNEPSVQMGPSVERGQ